MPLIRPPVISDEENSSKTTTQTTVFKASPNRLSRLVIDNTRQIVEGVNNSTSHVVNPVIPQQETNTNSECVSPAFEAFHNRLSQWRTLMGGSAQ